MVLWFIDVISLKQASVGKDVVLPLCCLNEKKHFHVSLQHKTPAPHGGSSHPVKARNCLEKTEMGKGVLCEYA